jgi:hypothetical protein
MGIKLGDTVKDKITGLRGIVFGISAWLYSNITIGIVPEFHKEGKPAETVWFDEDRLEVVKPDQKKKK